MVAERVEVEEVLQHYLLTIYVCSVAERVEVEEVLQHRDNEQIVCDPRSVAEHVEIEEVLQPNQYQQMVHQFDCCRAC